MFNRGARSAACAAAFQASATHESSPASQTCCVSGIQALRGPEQLPSIHLQHLPAGVRQRVRLPLLYGVLSIHSQRRARPCMLLLLIKTVHLLASMHS